MCTVDEMHPYASLLFLALALALALALELVACACLHLTTKPSVSQSVNHSFIRLFVHHI